MYFLHWTIFSTVNCQIGGSFQSRSDCLLKKFIFYRLQFTRENFHLLFSFKLIARSIDSGDKRVCLMVKDILNILRISSHSAYSVPQTCTFSMFIKIFVLYYFHSYISVGVLILSRVCHLLFIVGVNVLGKASANRIPDDFLQILTNYAQPDAKCITSGYDIEADAA